MSISDQSPPPLPQVTPPGRRRGCFFYGCLTVLSFVVLAAVFFAVLFSYAGRNLGPVAEAYLARVGGGDYQSAYEMIGPKWKQAQTFDQYVRFEKSVRNTLGSLKQKTMTAATISSTNGNNVAQLGYDAQFENGTGVLRFTLVKYADGWTIEGLKYDSPVLRKLLVCPSCGTSQAQLAGFCSSCGKPMDLSTSASLAVGEMSEPQTAASDSPSTPTLPSTSETAAE